MDKIEVEGINSLKGNILISGSKNSSLPILASSLLIDDEMVISNVPNLSDIKFMIKILKSLGSKVDFKNSICKIKSSQPPNLKISYDLVRKMRASFLILGPLLTKYGYAEVSLPGGCAIGSRPVDFHISALEKMGVTLDVEQAFDVAQPKDLEQPKSLEQPKDVEQAQRGGTGERSAILFSALKKNGCRLRCGTSL